MTTTKDIETAVANSVGVARDVAKQTVRATVGAIAGALVAGERVKVMGLGVFDTFTRKARVGRDPRNGDDIDIPARRDIKFKPSPELKDKL